MRFAIQQRNKAEKQTGQGPTKTTTNKIRGSKVLIQSFKWKPAICAKNSQTPQQQETLLSNHLRLPKADAPSFSSKQSSHARRKRNNKKLTSSGFKKQPMCTPLATTNKIIYKTACSDGPNAGSGKSQNSFAQKGLPSCPSVAISHKVTMATQTLHFCNSDTKNFEK